jgi:hypothetical protein
MVEWSCSPVFLTSILDGGSFTPRLPFRPPPRYPLDRKLGAPEARSLSPVGNRTPSLVAAERELVTERGGVHVGRVDPRRPELCVMRDWQGRPPSGPRQKLRHKRRTL